MTESHIARRTELSLPLFDPSLYRGMLTHAALMHNDNWLLLDETNGVLRRHGPGGQVLWETGQDELLYPRGVMALDEQSLVVLDSWKHRLVFYDIYLKQTHSVGEYGSGIGCFRTPSALSRSPEGDLLVCDTGNHRIVTVERNGICRVACKARTGLLFARKPVQKPILQWEDPLPLLYPQGIACNRYGEVCVNAPHALSLVLFNRLDGGAADTVVTGSGEEQLIPTGVAPTQSRGIWLVAAGNGYYLLAYHSPSVWSTLRIAEFDFPLAPPPAFDGEQICFIDPDTGLINRIAIPEITPIQLCNQVRGGEAIKLSRLHYAGSFPDKPSLLNELEDDELAAELRKRHDSILKARARAARCWQKDAYEMWFVIRKSRKGTAEERLRVLAMMQSAVASFEEFRSMVKKEMSVRRHLATAIKQVSRELGTEWWSDQISGLSASIERHGRLVAKLNRLLSSRSGRFFDHLDGDIVRSLIEISADVFVLKRELAFARNAGLFLQVDEKHLARLDALDTSALLDFAFLPRSSLNLFLYQYPLRLVRLLTQQGFRRQALSLALACSKSQQDNPAWPPTITKLTLCAGYFLKAARLLAAEIKADPARISSKVLLAYALLRLRWWRKAAALLDELEASLPTGTQIGPTIAALRDALEAHEMPDENPVIDYLIV